MKSLGYINNCYRTTAKLNIKPVVGQRSSLQDPAGIRR